MGSLVFSNAVAALGREAVVHLPTVAVPTAVTLAEANAAGTIHLTCNIRQFNPTADQAKTKKYRLCSKQGFDQLGRIDWTIERVRLIDDPQAVAPFTSTYPHKALVPGTKGNILRRRGFDTDPGNFVPFAAGQIYDLFAVEYGVQVPVPVAPEEEGQEFEYDQEIAVVGPRVVGVIVAA